MLMTRNGGFLSIYGSGCGLTISAARVDVSIEDRKAELSHSNVDKLVYSNSQRGADL